MSAETLEKNIPDKPSKFSLANRLAPSFLANTPAAFLALANPAAKVIPLTGLALAQIPPLPLAELESQQEEVDELKSDESNVETIATLLYGSRAYKSHIVSLCAVGQSRGIYLFPNRYSESKFKEAAVLGERLGNG